MGTKLYLHDEAYPFGGTLPSAPQVSLTPTSEFTGSSTLRLMDTTIGTSQASLTLSESEDIAHITFVGWWATPPLTAGTTVSSTLNDLRILAAHSENSTNMNYGINYSWGAYIWRPSTGTRVQFLGNDEAIVGEAEPNAINTEKAILLSDSAINDTATHLDGDIVVFELWARWNPTGSAAYVANFYYDGTVDAEDSTNTTVSDKASFIEFVQDTWVFDDGEVDGAAAFTLGAMTLASDSDVAIAGALSKTLGAMTLSSDSDVALAGAASITLGALTLLGEFTITTAGEFSGEFTLGDVTIASDSDVRVAGAASPTLGALTLSSTFEAGFPERIASASITLSGLSLAASMGCLVVCAASIQLAGMTLIASTEEPITGDGRMGLESFVSAYDGALGDQVHNFLLANTTGTTASWTTSDLWLQFFTELGYVSGTVNDRMREFLVDYTAAVDTGQTINDLWALIDAPYVP